MQTIIINTGIIKWTSNFWGQVGPKAKKAMEMETTKKGNKGQNEVIPNVSVMCKVGRWCLVIHNVQVEASWSVLRGMHA